jgi:hypothetical protein
MGTERNAVSDLEGTTLHIRRAEQGRTEFEDICYQRNHLIIYRAGGGKNAYVASVRVEDLFDSDGNRFYND